VESEAIGSVGVGEATIPQIQLFNQVLGLDEHDFLKNTQGTFKLGIQFENWGKPGDTYQHAFGGIGIGLGLLDFYQYWIRAQQEGVVGALWDYSLNAVASKENVFAPLTKVGDTALPGIKYAYHFDAALYAKYLREYSEKRGVKRIEGIIQNVRLYQDTGAIQDLVLESGEQISGDFFIDCSGFRGLLIEEALHTGFDDWSHWLPCDRAVAVPCASSQPLLPYTKAIAHSAGWQWRIPLQHRIGNGHVYCSRYMSDDEAQSILKKNLDGEQLAEPRVIKFITGKRKKFWNKNCLAIGLASGFIEPLESTSIHLVQVALSKFVDLFPHASISPVEIDEFNRQLADEYTHIRDFLILHYYANQRADSAFWRDCQTMEIPDGVTRKINLFESSGRIFRYNNELFSELGWLQVMHGQNIRPQQSHPLTNQLSPAQLTEYMVNVKTIVDKAVKQMPSHQDYIARYCAAK
jgi:tryptophan halogenase